jgi:hypothetical protein
MFKILEDTWVWLDLAKDYPQGVIDYDLNWSGRRHPDLLARRSVKCYAEVAC